MNDLSLLTGRRRMRLVLLVLVLITVLVAVVPAASAETAGASSGYYYTVQWGDTLYRIAVRNGTNVQTLAQANHLVNPNYIYAGQVLWIPTGITPPPPPPPACRYYHTVTWGDTLLKLSNWYGVSSWSIAQANGIYNMNLIYRGQSLCIP